MSSLGKVGVLVGRILMALIFLLSGISKFANPSMMVAYMKMSGVPAPQPLLYVSAIIEVGCGLLLLIGFRPRIMALILFLFLIPVTIMMHAIPGGQMNQIQVMKNFAIMGGLLIVAAQGANAYAVSAD